jgi:hypothetical protein
MGNYRNILMSDDSMRSPSAIWWLIPLIGLLLFWILNLVMPLNANDFGSSVFLQGGKPRMIASLSQLIQSLRGNFFSFNSRLGLIYYRISLFFLPKWLNNLFITLWVGGLIFLLLHIALRRKVQPAGLDMTLWLGILSVIFLPLQRVENYIAYTSGLYSYIPGGVGTLLVLDKISSWFIEEEDSSTRWWIYPVAFAAGWWHEVYGFFMIPLFALLFFRHAVIEKKPLSSVPAWILYLMLSFTAGFAFLVLAPGTQARASLQINNGFLASFIMSAILYTRFGLLTTPFSVGLVFMLLLFMRKENPLPGREKIFFSLLLVSTAGIIPSAAVGEFIPYGRALWGVYLVLAIILVWAASHLIERRIWLATVPVVIWAFTFFGILIWNTYVVRMEFEHIEQAFIEAGRRGEKVLLVDFPELRKEPHCSIMRELNRVVLVQRDPKHWFNTGLIDYYNALHSGEKGFIGPSYIVLDNLVPPHLSRYAFDTKDDPLKKYPEIQSLIEQQEAGKIRVRP